MKITMTFLLLLLLLLTVFAAHEGYLNPYVSMIIAMLLGFRMGRKWEDKPRD